LQELRDEFDKFDWLLTAPLGVIPDTIEHSFDIPAISKYLDYMFALCYAYRGDWNKQTGPNAPLYPLFPDDEYNVVSIHCVYNRSLVCKQVCYVPTLVYGNLQQTVACVLLLSIFFNPFHIVAKVFSTILTA
jgi:GH18 family chitinase